MIAIAGAGIGGLTLGCALAKHGIPFLIFERAAALLPAGAGITLAKNALSALAHIELDEAVRAAGQELKLVALRNRKGRTLVEARFGGAASGAFLAMTRARLQEILFAHLDPRCVRLGCEVVGYERTPDGIRLRAQDGRAIDATILVGADGLNSTVRRAMRGEEPLRYAGYTSWRALVSELPLADVHRSSETWGPGKRFGIVPLGGRQVYWFAVADAAASGRDDPDPRPALSALFAGWHDPVPRLISSTPAHHVLRTDIFDRAPIERWADHRVVLLGDAAHPMTPNLGQGGCQAIEDAVVLADALGSSPDPGEALLRYQSRRLRRANRFVVRSRQLGRLAHLRSAPLRWLRDQALRAVPRGLATRSAARDLDFRL